MATDSQAQPPAPTPDTSPARIHLLGGLPPFNDACDFTLLICVEAPPFLTLQCVDKKLAWTLVNPFLIVENYAPHFSEADWQAVGLAPQDKPLVLAIVNLREGVQRATINLIGPLLINPATGRGKQVVIENASAYSPRHRLLQD
ncbi:MAG: flagellar assembly protein FliW [Planctomycetota bacterium]